MSFTLSLIDAKIYIHAEDQFLDLNGRMGYKAYVGERFQSQVTVQEILQVEYKNVRNGLALTAKDKSCSYDVYDKCIYDKVASVMKNSSSDHCTVPWIRNDRNICSRSNDINTTFWIGWNRITNQGKDCLTPCRTTLVNVGAKNNQRFENRTYSQVYFYFSPRVMKSQERYLYSFLKLVAQIGGYLGLYRIFLWFLELSKFNTLRGRSMSKTKDSIKHNKNATNNLMSLSALALESI